MSIGPHLLGRVQEHDPESRNYAVARRMIPPPTKPITHLLAVPHLNQADIGACEGFTAGEFTCSALAIRNRRAFWQRQTGKRYSRYLTASECFSLYSAATELDQFPGIWPGQDTGTSGLGVAKALQRHGAIERYEWTFTWPAFLDMLRRQPVMLGTNWYELMFRHDDHGVIRVGGDVAGGHAYLAFAWRPAGYFGPGTPSYTGCTNHWVWDDGTPWGVQIGKHPGCFWIPDTELEQLLIHEGGESLVPVLL